MRLILAPCILIWNIVVSQIVEAGEPEMEKNKYVRIVTTQGNTAVLPCMINFRDVEKNDRRKYSVTWSDESRRISINNRVLQNHRKFQVSNPYPNEWNLKIIRAHNTDSGQYKCQVDTSPVQTKVVEFVVQVPPRISSSDNLEVKENERLVIYCNVTGDPPPTVRWFKENKYLQQYSGEKLVIDETHRSDTGLYRCEGENGVGVPDSEDITVDVLYVPIIQSLSSDIYGTSAVISCDTIANPEETVTWYDKTYRELRSNWKYNMVKTEHSDGSRTHRLEIGHFGQDDFGQYTCKASNTVGLRSKTITVTDITTSTKYDVTTKKSSRTSGSFTYIPDKSEQKDNEGGVPGSSSRSSSCCQNLLMLIIIVFIYISL